MPKVGEATLEHSFLSPDPRSRIIYRNRFVASLKPFYREACIWMRKFGKSTSKVLRQLIKGALLLVKKLVVFLARLLTELLKCFVKVDLLPNGALKKFAERGVPSFLGFF